MPDWQVSFTHFDQLHDAKAITQTIGGEEKPSLLVTLKEPRTNANMGQSIAARALRGKTIIFSGSLEMFEEPASAADSDSDLPGGKTTCYTRGAEVYMTTTARGGKVLSKSRIQVGLLDGRRQTFECSVAVPEQAVNVHLGIMLHGPIRASISDLSLVLEEPARLRTGQGPKNLELLPFSGSHGN